MKLFFLMEACSKNGILVLGTFDGVHLGHQALLKKGKELAKKSDAPLIFSTFYPHPLHLIAPGKAPKELTTAVERVCLVAKEQVDEMIIWHFTDALRSLSAQDFIEKVILPLEPKGIVIGFNYSFGKNGLGTPEKMKEYGKKYGFFVEEVPPVTNKGEVVSSTVIRNYLLEGNVKRATELLSKPYSIQGKIVHGKKAGGKLGFATANMLPPKDKILPAYGVYIAQLKTQEGIYPAILNIGSQPTLPSGLITIETHLLNENINLYGQKVRVYFLQHIRNEKAFSTVEELQSQVANDIHQAKAYFNI